MAHFKIQICLICTDYIYTDGVICKTELSNVKILICVWLLFFFALQVPANLRRVSLIAYIVKKKKKAIFTYSYAYMLDAFFFFLVNW